MKYFKNKKGITLISLIVYIILSLIILGILGLITSTFRSNVKDMNAQSIQDVEFDKINVQLLKETKDNNNTINTDESSETQIVFKNENMYSYIASEQAIFLNNDIKVADNIESCIFEIEESENRQKLIVNVKINGINRVTEYIISKYIVPRDGSWDEAKGVNSPNLLDGMIAIYWDNSGNEITEEDKEFDWLKWYDYKNQENGIDKTSRWANAKTEDGSYWVWIPRYAYKITSTTTDYTKAGTIDVIFLKNTTNKDIEDATYDMPTEDDDTTTKYIVHPAFCGTGYEELGGGFGTTAEGITGFWVAKYEMSMEGNINSEAEVEDEGWTTLTPTVKTSTTEISGNVGTTNTLSTSSVTDGINTYVNIRAVSKPNVSSWRFINVSNMYENAYNYDRNKDSHMMKNSEWGAVAYLTHSSYGRNGIEVSISDKGYIAGACESSSSSTGNITGIYDLSGAAYEYVAAFNDAYSDTGDYYSITDINYSSCTENNIGKTGLTTGTSTKYLTAYSNSTNTYKDNFTVGKVSIIGDAIKEVYASDAKSWNSNCSKFAYVQGPFILRGGSYNDILSAGLFYSSDGSGGGGETSYRVVCL